MWVSRKRAERTRFPITHDIACAPVTTKHQQVSDSSWSDNRDIDQSFELREFSSRMVELYSKQTYSKLEQTKGIKYNSEAEVDSLSRSNTLR